MGVRDSERVFCSTIIPTIGRPTLARAVESVLAQRTDAGELEVIVVNDSGKPLTDAAWRRSPRVRLVVMDRQERSVARNAGAALATGQYLHFLDDDDELLPGALQAFWRLSTQTDAAWLYGSYRTVDNDGMLVEEFRPAVRGNVFALLMSGEMVPFQASLILATAFVAAGGFDPTQVIFEDGHLARALALTCDIAWTPAVVAQIRVGRVGASGNWSRFAEMERRSFELYADHAGALARIGSSSGLDAYRYGRLSRAYLASTLWNLRRRSFRLATRRLPLLLSFAIRGSASRNYWRGLWHTGWPGISREGPS